MKRRISILATGCLLAPFLACFACGCVVIPIGDLLKPIPLQETLVEEGEGLLYRPKVAIIDLEGTITGREVSSLVYSRPNALDEAQARLERVERDPEVVALLLRISSPGGEATACDVIRREVASLKEKRKIPVVACIVDTGASGGYYIATAADRIVAHPTAVVGSIGAILQTINVRGLFEKIGVDMVTVKSGDFKDLASPFEEVSAEEVTVLQEVVDALHARFVDVVDEGRAGLSRDQVAALADGKVYAAARARDLGLVDEIGYLADAVEEARSLAGHPAAAVVRYTRAGRPGRNLYSLAGADAPAAAAPADGGLSLTITAAELPRTRFLYLWVP